MHCQYVRKYYNGGYKIFTLLSATMEGLRGEAMHLG